MIPVRMIHVQRRECDLLAEKRKIPMNIKGERSGFASWWVM
jgi:hypothetical protein